MIAERQSSGWNEGVFLRAVKQVVSSCRSWKWDNKKYHYTCQTWTRGYTGRQAQSITAPSKARQRGRKSKVTPRNAHVCSHLPLSRSPSLFITPYLRSRSHSVFLWNRPSVMSTEISRHSAGASAGLTFLLPVIYIREGAHGGFSMPAKEGAATALLASTQGLDAVRDSNNGGTDHQAQRCLHSEKEAAWLLLDSTTRKMSS